MLQQQTQENVSNLAPAFESNCDTPTAAKFLKISPRTLERWRVEGKGPTYSKLGSRVIYAHSDLVEFQKQNIRTSTSEEQ